MKLLRMLSAVVLVLPMLMVAPKIPQARVMMVGSISDFFMDVRSTASFTVDDWLNTPGMFTITVSNGDTKTVKRARISIEISSSVYGTVLTGVLTVVDSQRPDKAFLEEMRSGQTFTVNNTMINEDSDEMSGGDWSQEFKDEVLRIGALPEGTYTMKFTLEGYYESSNDPIEEGNIIDSSMDIKNPTPPELMVPDDMSDDVVTVPRFAWQRPLVSDLTGVNPNRVIMIYYNITLWRMFGTDGSVISEEDAIQRVPIWKFDGLNTESIDFDPNSSWEELIPGRKYCWQVQAVDGEGRPISSINDGKSDVWQFACQFTPPVLNEPFSYFPFQCSWSGAQAGGGVIYYRIRIADNADFAGGFEEEGMVMTNFRYPQDGPPLRLGETYYIELQSTDDAGIPIGEPETSTFRIPVATVTLRSPADGTVPSTIAPQFTWDARGRYFLVTIYDEQSDWSFISGAVEGTSWTYDGEDLQPGKTYAWNVAPANEMGDPVGDSSDTWYFSLAPENQVTLVSPVNQDVESLTPSFSWRAISVTSGTVEYNIVIQDQDGNTVHSATVASTTYQYPDDAPELSNAARYSWSVNAESNNVEIGIRSEPATFTTPFAEAGDTTATLEDLTQMVLLVLADYPQYDSFKNKVLVSISDESGPLTPSAFLELFETFKIVSVSAQ